MTIEEFAVQLIGFNKDKLGYLIGYGHDFLAWPLECHCGKECKRILETAQPLIEMVDPVVVDKLLSAVFKAMQVICNG